MTTARELGQRLRKGFEKAQTDQVWGITGLDNEDNTFTLKVPDETNMVYVRLYGDAAQTHAVYNSKQLKSNVKVFLKQTGKGGKGKYRITDTDVEFNTEAFGEAATQFDGAQTYGELDTKVTEGRNLKPGRIRITELGGLVVYVEPFHYMHLDVPAYWPGGTIDLTSYVPGTSNMARWVKVGVDPTTNSAVAAAGTTYPVLFPLTDAELSAVSFAGYIPCFGVQLRNGQTAITDERTMSDCRLWIWQSAAGASVLVSDTVTTVSPASEIEFNATYFDVTDGGGGVAEVTLLPEAIQDLVAALLAEGANINLTYDDGANTLTIAVSGLVAADISDFDTAAQTAVAGSPPPTGHLIYDAPHWCQVFTDGNDILYAGATVAITGGTRASNHDANTSWVSFTTAVTTTTAGFDTSIFDQFQSRHNPVFVWRIKVGDLTNARYWFGLTSGNLGTSDTAAGHCAAFRWSASASDGSNWKYVTRDGTTQNVTTGDAIAANTEYLLKIRLTSTHAYFSVNGGSETDVTTNLPSSTQGLGFAAVMRPTTATSETWNFSKMAGYWGS